MDRTIQIGDSAIVSVGDQKFSYPIVSIDPLAIRTSNYLLIPVGNQWQIQGYNTPHTVTFVQRSTFTGVPEIDWNILLRLDSLSLTRACQTSPTVNQICQNEEFWRAKIRRDLGELDRYKPDEISYQKQYQDLIQAKDPNNAARDGRLDLLILLGSKNLFPDRLGIGLAAENGHLHVLQWLAESDIRLPRGIAFLAASSGRLNILQWLAEREILPDQLGANWAAREGHIHVLQWLADRNIFPDEDGVNAAAENGHLRVLDWLAERNILPDQRAANRAAREGHVHVLQWLAERNIYPN